MDETIIRRTVSIPKQLNNVNILALIEVGGKLYSKDLVYQKFFEYGLKGVMEDIQKEISKKGGSEKKFNELMKKAAEKFS